VYLRGYDDDEVGNKRIAADQVENEMNRLRGALQESRSQIEDIKHKQERTLGESELRIFDAHIAYLSDPMFVTEIEDQIVQERFGVREAVRLVVAKYDRIFQLVESDMLRRRASDLRDVATRLLRNLGDAGGASQEPPPAGRYILAAKKLATADMFNLENERVDGIVAEQGGMSSHAAILARGMGIPTLTGIRDLPRLLGQSTVAIIDAGAGELLVDPGEQQLREFSEQAQRWKKQRVEAPEDGGRHELRCGSPVHLLGSCGSAGEAELSRTFGLAGIGVFRTELAFLTEGRPPTEDELVNQYRQVIKAQEGRAVNFRLLDVAASTLDPELRLVERNPAMGARGVRGLLQNPDVLRLQLRAILRAAAGTKSTGVLVPFVSTLSELQRVKAAALEERVALQKAKVEIADRLLMAPIIEVPAASLVIGALLDESDFAVIALDDLQAHLLAADRDNNAVRSYHELVHPALFETLMRMAREAVRHQGDLVLFGESAADPVRLPFYLGVGYRRFSIAPVRLRGLMKVLAHYSADECRRISARVLEAPRTLDVQKVLVNLDPG